MLELLGLKTVFSVVGSLYLLLVLAGICLALWKGKSWLRRAIYVVAVLILFFAPIAPEIHRAAQYRSQVTQAKALFAERCKKSGEFIHRTVDDVEGVFLLKLRPDGINYGDQFKLDDPYGSDLIGKGYVESFLRGSFQANHKGAVSVPGTPAHLGYLYVEANDPKDGKRYRYTGGVKEIEVTSSTLLGGNGQKFKTMSFVVDQVLAPGKPPQYGVTYDDISTQEEREHWIAGSSLKVIDLSTGEVMAERVGYMVDWGQGGRGGGRSPWLFAAANACPAFDRNYKTLPEQTLRSVPASSFQSRQTQEFVEKVLHPTVTEAN